MRRTLRLTGAALCTALAVWFLAPLVLGVCHIGMFYPAALCLLAAAALLFPERLRRLYRGRSRPWALTGTVVLGVGLAGMLAVLLAMGAAAGQRPTAAHAPNTVIVLGCQVTEGRPSVMLESRIDAAYDYLTDHPQAVCVASGGMDDGEDITEAQCIYHELTRRGIAPQRLFREERSRSTAENLAYSAAVIRQAGLDSDVAIASDNFHQLRAFCFARREGLTPCSLGCRSVWYLSGGYWTREIVGLAAAWLRGY